MKALMTLVKREYWEQTNLFFKLPLALSVIISIAAFCLLLGSAFVQSPESGLTHWHVQLPLLHGDRGFYFVTSLPFMVVLWLTLFYYFTATLYDDRKDRSVLFWQSMPISQTQIIGSKVLAGVVIAPLFAWGAVVVTQLILMIFASVFLMIHPLWSWGDVWNVPGMLYHWIGVLVVMVVQAIWLLPLLAWCMLWSAYAKKMPSISAIVSAVVIVVIEAILLPIHAVAHFIVSRFGYAMNTWNALHLQGGQFFNLTDFGWNMLLGLVVAVVFLAIAGRLRSRCYDFDN